LPTNIISLGCIKGEIILPSIGERFRSNDIIAITDRSLNLFHDWVRFDDTIYLREKITTKVFVERTLDFDFKEEDGDCNLARLGISSQICNYIAEYALGKYLEQTSPSEATTHINTAESYFTNLPTAERKLTQKTVLAVNQM
jgi:hypothetical protein